VLSFERNKHISKKVFAKLKFFPSLGGYEIGDEKAPVNITLYNRVLEKIDKEASKQKSSSSEYVELHFENVFFEKKELNS
jgi:hypothetical protein